MHPRFPHHLPLSSSQALNMPGGDTMLTELLTRERFADLERERKHMALLASARTPFHFTTMFARIGKRITTLGTWMQQLEVKSA